VEEYGPGFNEIIQVMQTAWNLNPENRGTIAERTQEILYVIQYKLYTV